MAIATSKSRIRYPVKRNSLVQGFTVLFLESCLIMQMLIPGSFSGLVYGLMLLFLFVFTAIFILYSDQKFRQLHADNYFITAGARTDHTKAGEEKLFTSRVSKQLFHKFPFLAKNLLQNQRAKTSSSAIILAVLFIIAAYLLAMNNHNSADRVNVLFGLLIIYIILYSSAVINKQNSLLESAQIIYALPIRILHIHLSLFIPAFIWLTAVATIMTFSLLTAGVNGFQLTEFWLKSLFSSAATLILAINTVIVAYPNTKLAQKRFGYWLFAIVLGSAVLFEFRFYLTAFVIILSLFPIKNVRLFHKSSTSSAGV